MHRYWLMFLAMVLFSISCSHQTALGQAPEERRPMRIRVVDDQTGRGIPLVELKTTNQRAYYTDSAGNIAFYEAGLMNQPVFFYIASHGYHFPKDPFGWVGTAIEVKEGGEAVIRMKRMNIAERLYRITGEGVYRDSLLLGDAPPIRQPLLNAQVIGQDTVFTAIYKGKLYWFWGDTGRPAHPLGNFQTTGATSELPGKGGLAPSVGIDLTYFTDETGFTKRMFPITWPDGGNVLVWIGAVTVVPDENGQEKLICHYSARRGLTAELEKGLGVFNDEKDIFEKAVVFNLEEKWRFLQGHPVPIKENGVDYLLFSLTWPNVRARADLKSLKDSSTYEAFTCLAPGGRYDKENAVVERDAQGNAVWGWKVDTDPIGQDEEQELIKAGKLKPEEAHFQLINVLDKKPVKLHRGSFCWNEYRKKWILIGCEIFGASALGEIWYAEADAPTGPWGKARKIVTHNKYSFYNPTQHPFFDEEGGRIIYFEGTYTREFSGNDVPTPAYDYNQIMYRLDLDDPRLKKLH